MPVLQQNQQAGSAGSAAFPGLLVYASDIIKAALRSIGAYDPNEQPTAAEMQQSLFTANQMLDSWNAQRLMIYAINRVVLNPLTLKQTYSVGPGGDFNIARPPKIARVSVINIPSSTQPYEMPIPMLNEQEWQAIPVKNTVGALPINVWDDNQFPLRNLNFWPIPNVAINFAIYPWQQLSLFADLNVSLYAFPPAYLRAIKFSLALELAPEFPGDDSKIALVSKLAEQAVRVIKGFNKPSMQGSCDPAIVNLGAELYNWLTDEPAGR